VITKKRPERMYCSRFSRTKIGAVKIASEFRAVGGIDVKITGRRGCWRVRGKVEIARFAKFCADEAQREQAKK
jgi:hypothetical protein